MSDKIRISLDDVNSHEVDGKVQQHSAMARATDHYQQQVGPSMGSPNVPTGKTSIWYNSLLYMTLFGLLGGLLAWPVGEMVRFVMTGHVEAYRDFEQSRIELLLQLRSGELTPSEALSRFEELKLRYEDNEYVAIGYDETLTDAEKNLKIEMLDEKETTKAYIMRILWCAVSGMAIAVCLSIADSAISRNMRDALINGSVGLCLGMLGGVIVGLFVNQIYLALLDLFDEPGIVGNAFARSIGWGILGLFLAIAPGIVMKSPKKLVIGLIGGLIGGLLGGILFDLAGYLTGSDLVSRLVGFVSIGAIAGLGTGLIENAAKTGWMKVVGGLIAGKQFILYKNPTLVGSSPQCEIYLFKDVQVAPQHAAIRQIPQGYEIQDMQTNTGTLVNGRPVSRAKLNNNDQIQIGGTVFMFQEKNKT